MKNLYNISSEEKNRILMLHEQTNTALDKYKIGDETSKFKSNLKLDFNKKSNDPEYQQIYDDFQKWYKENSSNTVLQNLIKNNNGKGIIDILNYEFKDKPKHIAGFKELLSYEHPNLKFDEQPVPGNIIKPGVYSKEVEDLQKKLNEKFKANLVVDGKWGPLTSAAVIKYVPAT